MRPDPHKQAASRKYHNKVRSRGGSVAAAGTTTGATTAPQSGGRGEGNTRGSVRGGHGGSGGRGGYRGRGNVGKGVDNEVEDDEDENGEHAPRKSYARRKIVSNMDRYIEHDEEVTEAEELDQGIDRQTMAFREMLKDSDQKKTFDPAAYFRFKSEKEVEAQDSMGESQQTRKLLEIRLDDIESALMTLPIKERLYLQDADVKALDSDVLGKVSLSTGKPIVPKLVRGQAASDILIKPSAGPLIGMSSSLGPSPAYTHPASGISNASRHDNDLDELLDITKTYGRARPSVPTSSATPSKPFTPPSSTNSPPGPSTTGSKISLPPPLKGNKFADASGSTSAPTPAPTLARGLPPLKRGPPRSAGKKDEEWLDSVLGM
ncbi:hypothetical protein EDD11_001787 [Mortierella claussenii]|nr:hypothetical protein EDD11_001787 [Mortierella claussenii]